MATIHAKLAIIQSTLKAPKNQVNDYSPSKYKYRNCEDILEAAKPLLKENGLTLLLNDRIVNVGDRYYVEATAILTEIETGELVAVTASARETAEKKGMDEAQVTGASSSYARKYALNGMFAIDDTKDADSQDNTKSTPAKPASTQKTIQTPTAVKTVSTAQKPVSGLTQGCVVHRTNMKEYISKKNNEPYFAHQLEDGTWCYGKKK